MRKTKVLFVMLMLIGSLLLMGCAQPPRVSKSLFSRATYISLKYKAHVYTIFEGAFYYIGYGRFFRTNKGKPDAILVVANGERCYFSQ